MKRLLIRPGALGDFIVSIPALACLRGEDTEIWCAAGNVPLAARIAERARAIADTGLDLLELGHPSENLIAALRQFDSIVSWYGANRREFAEAAAAHDLPVRLLPALPAQGCGAHAVDFYLQQARAIAPCSSDGIPRIRTSGARGDFAVIHPFAGSQRKRWPFERFQELARRLTNRLPVEWCAGPEDELAGARRFENTGDLADWLASARVYIGNDSGPAHLAAAVGTPAVVMFGPTDPAVWAPRGPAVRVAAAPSLDQIDAGHVAELVLRTIDDVV